MLFSPSDGKRLGTSIRTIKLPTSDPRYARIGELQAELLARVGKPFFYGWQVTRTYAPRELAAAALCRLRVTSVFEPAGEECGTRYDESTACEECGSGAKQVGPLVLDSKSVPKLRDFSRTIAGEIVVSRRVTELFEEHGITGITLHPVRVRRTKRVDLAQCSQLLAMTTTTNVVAPTLTGNDPFDHDPDNDGRCSKGHLLGLNLLSEVTVQGAPTNDLVASSQFVGVRRGLLRPQRIILISPKLQELIAREGLSGCAVEIAHLQSGS